MKQLALYKSGLLCFEGIQEFAKIIPEPIFDVRDAVHRYLDYDPNVWTDVVRAYAALVWDDDLPYHYIVTHWADEATAFVVAHQDIPTLREPLSNPDRLAIITKVYQEKESALLYWAAAILRSAGTCYSSPTLAQGEIWCSHHVRAAKALVALYGEHAEQRKAALIESLISNVEEHYAA
jgi:hypothetical protein